MSRKERLDQLIKKLQKEGIKIDWAVRVSEVNNCKVLR